MTTTKTAIQLVPEGSEIYNAADAPGHLRGKNTKGERDRALAYSVYRVDGKGMAHCQSWDIFGKRFDECLPVAHLEAIEHFKRRN